jgi:chorismate synthase
MPANTFGDRFRITTFGESHGGGVGVVIDGVPAGLPFPHAEIAAQLARRRPGQGLLTSQRREADEVELLSGVDPGSGMTVGTPVALLVRNTDARGKDYETLRRTYRPSHADYTYDARFGARIVEGGGRASARETVARVAAGTLAEALLRARFGLEIVAWVDRVADVELPPKRVDEGSLTRAAVDAHEVRCPDPATAAAMAAAIDGARRDGDTVGGTIRCVARGVPAGLGEPVFDKLTGALAHALMSLPATRSFEIGEGLAATSWRGSAHNDAFVPGDRPGQIRTATNHSGGVQGGISNGEPLRLRVGFKPVATIFRPQATVDREGQATTYEARGRHDPCVLPRAVPMVEAMVALVLCDHALRRLGARAEELGR